MSVLMAVVATESDRHRASTPQHDRRGIQRRREHLPDSPDTRSQGTPQFADTMDQARIECLKCRLTRTPGNRASLVNEGSCSLSLDRRRDAGPKRGPAGVTNGPSMGLGAHPEVGIRHTYDAGRAAGALLASLFRSRSTLLAVYPSRRVGAHREIQVDGK